MIKLENDIVSIQEYLDFKSFLQADEKVSSVEIPGDGNMNFTLRAITTSGSYIIKQSRHYVEKYPQVAAPANRSQREAEFYRLVATNKELADSTPDILLEDPVNNILVMTDLGAGSDYSRYYKQNETIERSELRAIVNFISLLHASVNNHTAEYNITNTAMRKLNHEHMYVYPFMEDNGFNLDDIQEGLQEVSMKYKHDTELHAKVDLIGRRYLTNGDVLLHGDYFPGSWLMTDNGLKIIDPEFCFFGYPEFELGVMQAHLLLCNQKDDLIADALKWYGETNFYDDSLVREVCGVEIMRRLLGLAQVPVTMSLKDKVDLLDRAYNMTI